MALALPVLSERGGGVAHSTDRNIRRTARVVAETTDRNVRRTPGDAGEARAASRRVSGEASFVAPSGIVDDVHEPAS